MWVLHQNSKHADKHLTSYSTHEAINGVHTVSDFVFRMSLNQKGFASIRQMVFISPSRDSIHAITFDVFFPEKLGYNYSYQLRYPAIFFLSGKICKTLRYYCFVTAGECCF